MLTYLKQIFTLIKMVQLSPLIYERMRRNGEKHEEKIGPPDSISGRPLLHFGAALTPFWGGPDSILGRPWLQFGAALAVKKLIYVVSWWRWEVTEYASLEKGVVVVILYGFLRDIGCTMTHLNHRLLLKLAVQNLWIMSVFWQWNSLHSF